MEAITKMTPNTPLLPNHTKNDFNKFRDAFIETVSKNTNTPIELLLKKYKTSLPTYSVLYLRKNIEEFKILKKRIEPNQEKIYNEWLAEEKKKGNIK
jgi:hypothetical protein